MFAPAPALSLSDSDQQQLQQWASAFGTPQQIVLRCRIVLAAASGQSDNAIADQLEVNRHTVRLWRNRFGQEGLQSLWEIAPGRGRKPSYGPEKIQQIIDTTLRSKAIAMGRPTFCSVNGPNLRAASVESVKFTS